ncbi:SDR family oxidoreductase [Paenibacillus sp.]|uniref:SDR family oxidoreductase n=1 Tax=Paenibacillus sp. TaxID=58172 RepID=UPI003566B617
MGKENLDAKRPVALVTGASSGFGLLVSVTLARRGYRVVATMRNVAAREHLLERAMRDGVGELIETMPLDVIKPESIELAVAAVTERYGRIDALVNNAGMAVGGFVEDVPMERFREQLETNFFGLVAVTKAVLPHMRERRSGCIVNVSSISGRSAFPGYSAYAASKFAVEGFSESLRLEMRPYGVRVVLIEPGAYRTAIWQKGFDTICTSATSPYREPLARVLRYSRQAAQAAPDPREVADRIAGVVALSNPSLRYPLGRGAKIALRAKALLPWNLYERVLLRILN